MNKTTVDSLLEILDSRPVVSQKDFSKMKEAIERYKKYETTPKKYELPMSGVSHFMFNCNY